MTPRKASPRIASHYSGGLNFPEVMSIELVTLLDKLRAHLYTSGLRPPMGVSLATVASGGELEATSIDEGACTSRARGKKVHRREEGGRHRQMSPRW